MKNSPKNRLLICDIDDECIVLNPNTDTFLSLNSSARFLFIKTLEGLPPLDCIEMLLAKCDSNTEKNRALCLNFFKELHTQGITQSDGEHRFAPSYTVNSFSPPRIKMIGKGTELILGPTPPSSLMLPGS